MNLEDYAKSTLDMYKRYSGGVVNTADMAMALAEILVARFYGQAEAAAQMPFQATQKGDRWIIEGGQRKDLANPMAGPVTLILSRLDAQVIGVLKAATLPVPPGA
jgi:hypothetical protein